MQIQFRPLGRFAFLLVAALLFFPIGTSAQQADPVFKNEQLDQLLAPVALFPDSLLSQVLMAATYPADVADAAKWSKSNPNAKGDAAVKAVEQMQWDPSVQSLVAFPQVLAMMDSKPDWVQQLGDAFLAQPEGVMDSVQRLRLAAQKAGKLESSEQQKVIVEQPAPQETVIRIEPSNPQTVYVPSYNPSVVYGSWPYPSYPPVYVPPPPAYYPGAALATGLAFGTAVAVTNALWGGFNWGGNDVNINVNRYNNINTNRQISTNRTNTSWQHNQANRRGVPYRDAKSRQQYARDVPGAQARQEYRGRDADRARAQASVQQRQGERQAAGAAGGGQRAEARAGARDAQASRQAPQREARQEPRQESRQARSPQSRETAFNGINDSAQLRQQVDRGSASRKAVAQSAPRSSGGGRAGGGGGGGFEGRGGGRR